MESNTQQKFLSKIEFITIKSLCEFAKKIGNVESDRIYQAYPYLIKFAQRETRHRDRESIIGLAHMAYGWMPTMVKCDLKKYNDNLWGKIIAGDITKAFLSTMTAITNNSIVGASKLLHFSNPQKYAIWDSRVYRSITKDEPNNSKVNDIEKYIIYITHLRLIAKDGKTLKNYLIEQKHIKRSTSMMRCMELVLFYYHDKGQKSKKR